jgi:hypothetical protein
MFQGVEEIKAQIDALKVILKDAYRVDPKYNCKTCNGQGRIIIRYFGIGHEARLVTDICPDCFGRGYNPKLDLEARSRKEAKEILDKLDACPGDKELIERALFLLDSIVRTDNYL